jgi:hypothetical protein
VDESAWFSLETAKTKKPSFHKTENEGIRRIPPKDNLADWPHPSLCGEAWLVDSF